jgi:hypothetical protein
MVSQREALKSSTLTSGIVAASHGTAHYIAGGSQTLTDPVVMIAGTTVFATTWILSYTGMQGYLPF